MIDPTPSRYWDGTATRDELQTLARELFLEVVRCHRRLEIDRKFVPRDNYSAGTDWYGVEVEVPWSERETMVDGIATRDARLRRK